LRLQATIAQRLRVFYLLSIYLYLFDDKVVQQWARTVEQDEQALTAALKMEK